MSNLEQITTIIKDVLDNDDLQIGINDTAETVEGWDSLAQVRIVLAAEQEFGMRFAVEQIPNMTSVSALLDAVSDQ